MNLYTNVVDAPMNINKLHHKLDHLNYHTLYEMVSKGAISGIIIKLKSIPEFCSSCFQGKAHQQPFPKESKTKYTKYGKKIVTNLWGPAQVTSLGGHNYCQFYHDMAMGEDCQFLKVKSRSPGKISAV